MAKTNGKTAVAEPVPGGALKLEIPPLNTRTIEFTIIGDSPLIIHKWSDKAVQMIQDKQAKKAKQGRPERKPQEEYEAAMYRLPDGGHGVPSLAFKLAAVRGAKAAGMAMTDARTSFHVSGLDDKELARIEGDVKMRTDMVRLESGVSDVRYRPTYEDWKCQLRVEYNASTISPEQILNIFDNAGFGVGVGEWRPEKNGSYGRFHTMKTA